MGIVPGKNLQLRPVVIPCLITPPIVLNQVPHTLNCTPSLSTSSTKLSGSVSSNLNSTTSPQKTPKRNPSIRSSQTTCKGLSPTEAHTKRTLIREALEKLRKQQQVNNTQYLFTFSLFQSHTHTQSHTSILTLSISFVSF